MLGPLDGVKVVELGQFQQGPVAAMTCVYETYLRIPARIPTNTPAIIRFFRPFPMLVAASSAGFFLKSKISSQSLQITCFTSL